MLQVPCVIRTCPLTACSLVYLLDFFLGTGYLQSSVISTVTVTAVLSSTLGMRSLSGNHVKVQDAPLSVLLCDNVSKGITRCLLLFLVFVKMISLIILNSKVSWILALPKS